MFLKVQVLELEQKMVRGDLEVRGPGLGLVHGMGHLSAWLDSPVHATNAGQPMGWMWSVPHNGDRNMAER